MLEFTLPLPRDEILFKAVLEPTATAIRKLEMKKEMDEGELTTFLGKVSAQSNSGELPEMPIAHDMVPDEVLTEMKYRRKVSFSPGLKFSVGVIGTEAAIDVKTEKELIVHVPQIFALGINMPNVAGTLNLQKRKESGGTREICFLW